MTATSLPEQVHFQFMAGHPRARLSYRLTATLFLIGGLLTGFGLLVNSILHIMRDELSREVLIAIPVGLVLIGWTLMSACATYLTSAQITLSDDGLTAHVIGPWQISLTRTADQTFSLTPRHVQLPYRQLRDGEQLFTIPLAGVRPAERLAALYLGIGIRPVLFITPDHEDYQTLVRTLQPEAPFVPDPQELS